MLYFEENWKFSRVLSDIYKRIHGVEYHFSPFFAIFYFSEGNFYFFLQQKTFFPFHLQKSRRSVSNGIYFIYYIPIRERLNIFSISKLQWMSLSQLHWSSTAFTEFSRLDLYKHIDYLTQGILSIKSKVNKIVFIKSHQNKQKVTFVSTKVQNSRIEKIFQKSCWRTFSTRPVIFSSKQNWKVASITESHRKNQQFLSHNFENEKKHPSKNSTIFASVQNAIHETASAH